MYVFIMYKYLLLSSNMTDETPTAPTIRLVQFALSLRPTPQPLRHFLSFILHAHIRETTRLDFVFNFSYFFDNLT